MQSQYTVVVRLRWTPWKGTSTVAERKRKRNLFHYFIFSTLKGVVSRYFVVCFLVSFDSSEFPTHKERVHFRVVFNFLIVASGLGVVSLACESSWAIRLSAAYVVAPYTRTPLRRSWKCWFGGIILKMEAVPVRAFLQPVVGISGAPYYYPELFCTW
jgi:hypothetical protein